MTREERLEQIARELFEAKREEKEAKNNISELRNEFFQLHEEGMKGKDYLLPVQTVEVPDEFFYTTAMSEAEFIESRFPGWTIEHSEYLPDHKRTVFVLKKDPKFIAGVVDVEDGREIIRVSKEVSEYTPEIDWETLAKERQDLYSKIAVPVVSYTIDEDEFERLVTEHPEELAVIKRHMIVRTPTLRVTARKVKDERT